MSESKPIDWEPAGAFEDILYEKAEGIAKLTINRGGSYRMRAKLVYLGATSLQQTKYSTWKKFSVKK